MPYPRSLLPHPGSSPLPLLIGLAACSGVDVDRTGRPCNADGACAEGFVCDSNNVCIEFNGRCFDQDGDGVGDGTGGNIGCSGSPQGTIDSNDNDPNTCADTDGDTCDDCQSGTFNPANDGTDTDNDGLCDAGDTCLDIDGDGLGAGGITSGCINTTADTAPNDNTVCADTDNDGCDDCSQGSSFNPANDGNDPDADGICASGDTCEDSDSDGFGNGNLGNTGCPQGAATDANDNNANACIDTDLDSCDDCVGGTFNPANDGIDVDNDGLCDIGDNCIDADGDGVGTQLPNNALSNPPCLYAAGTDANDSDPNVCADSDGDGCDDCSNAVLPTFAPDQDGTDIDGDGICSNAGFDCDDSIPTCTGDCTTNSDATELVTVVDCREDYCGTDKNDPNSVCIIVQTGTALRTAAEASNNRILLNNGNDIIGISNQLTVGNGTRVTQTFGANDIIVSATAGPPGPAFELTDNSEVRNLNVSWNAGTNNKFNTVYSVVGVGAKVVGGTISGNVETAISVERENVEIRDVSFNQTPITAVTAEQADSLKLINNRISAFQERGYAIERSLNVRIEDNRITKGAVNTGGPAPVAIVLDDASGTELVGNIIVGPGLDAIHLSNADNATLLYNTIDDAGRALYFFSFSQVPFQVCAYANIFSNVSQQLIDESANDQVAWNSECDGAAASDSYRNVLIGSNTCQNTCQTDCRGCLPAFVDFFLNYNSTAEAFETVSMPFQSTTASNATYYCPKNPVLIDAGNATVLEDRNGNDTGNANGNPDIGARESGSLGCPAVP